MYPLEGKIMPPRVNIIYLVPSDRHIIATDALELVGRNLQLWYADHMDTHKTFTLNKPVVRVYRTSHPSSWYSNNPNPSNPNYQWLWFWNNVNLEARNLAGAGFNMPEDRWLIFVAAEPLPGQIAGGASGIAVLSEKYMRAAMAKDPDWTQCQAYGSVGHELGHAFILPHPPTPWTNELMGVGYLLYPDAFLTAADQAKLNSSQFFRIVEPLPGELECKTKLPK